MKLALVVVDDSAIASAINRRRGEWQELTGARIEISEITSADLLSSSQLGADAVIYPSRHLGFLAEKGLIALLRRPLLDRHHYPWADVFDLVREREIVWGQRPMAVPLGSPVLTLMYRADLFAAQKLEPPATWNDYARWAERFARRENLGQAAPPAGEPWFGAIEPLASGWASRTLLARAAAYARHRSHYSTLFDIETMQPLIAGPPFVRALEELIAAAKASGAPPMDPAGVRRAFRAGQAAMALSWPTADQSDSVETTHPVGFAELPGSPDVFNIARQDWEIRAKEDDARVTLLAISGRLGSVVAKTQHVAGAHELLTWLSGGQMSSAISAASPDTTLFRRSHVESPGVWLDRSVDSAAARQYSRQVETALNRSEWLAVPRIPGADEYLEALDKAVEQVLKEAGSPAETLTEAAGTWQQITKKHGLEAQRRAYRRSLGLEP